MPVKMDGKKARLLAIEQTIARRIKT